MVEAGSNFPRTLTLGQLNLIARHAGVFSGKTLVDVGCGDGSWFAPLRLQGRHIQGMEEKSQTNASPSEALAIGSPAAATPWEPHSRDAILFRGTSLFQAAEFNPELMIGLANLGSSLKARGRLLIPIFGNTPTEIEADLLRWKCQLSVFPGTFRSRLLTSGLRAYFTLAFLFGKNFQVTVIEFQVDRKVVSRLEWHQLARTAVMSRLNSPAVA